MTKTKIAKHQGVAPEPRSTGNLRPENARALERQKRAETKEASRPKARRKRAPAKTATPASSSPAAQTPAEA